MTADAEGTKIRAVPTADSFQNMAARIGIGAGMDNQAAGATYALNAVTRNRMLCDMLFRGSWMAKQGVNAFSEDMIRAGININSTMEAGAAVKLQNSLVSDAIWNQMEETISWARLYGGCIGFLMIEGQDPSTPLRVETIGRGQFRGVLPLDRWVVRPTTEELVTEFGPEFGRPMYYLTNASAMLPNMKIHHSRALRFVGDELPYWQKISELGWGLSVLEPFYDRLVAFDSTTQGAAQLIYRAHLRTLYLPGLREAIAAGGPALDQIIANLGMIRKYQGIEGLTLLDGEDKLDMQAYTFSGLDLVLIQFAQQLSGALQIPLVRLFGQSPAGLNATGDSDIRLYYDAIASKQTKTLENPLAKILQLQVRSLFGTPPPEDFGFDFNPLWQLSGTERVEIAEKAERTIAAAVDSGLLPRHTGMEELRGLSRETGFFGSITDEQIAEVEAEPPMAGELLPEVPGPDGNVVPLRPTGTT